MSVYFVVVVWEWMEMQEMHSHCLILDKYSMEASALVLILLQAQGIRELLRSLTWGVELSLWLQCQILVGWLPHIEDSIDGFYDGGVSVDEVSMKPQGKDHFYSTFLKGKDHFYSTFFKRQTKTLHISFEEKLHVFTAANDKNTPEHSFTLSFPVECK